MVLPSVRVCKRALLRHHGVMHILIVKLSSIGDVVHAMPAAAALRRAFPEARLTWVVEKVAAPLLVGAPVLDEVVVLDTRGWRKSLRRAETRAAIADRYRAVRRNRPDVALDFQGLLKSAAVARLSGARERIGFSTDALRERASRFGYTRQIPVDDAKHVIFNNLKLAEAIGAVMPERYEFPFPPFDEPAALVAERLAVQGIERFVILNPGGGWVTKLWPPRDFAALVDHVWEEFGLASVVTCGPGEERMAEAIVGGAKSGKAAFIPTTLPELIALIRQAELFVGGDTGPLHLAAAAGTPIVGIYGPTMPERNGPFNPADVTVGRDIPCRVNCHRRTCDHHICMDIPVERVAEAIRQRMKAEG